MKRKNDLYKNMCRIENIMNAFDEVCKNTKNKRKVNRFKDFKCVYISKIYNTLINKTYEVGPYNVFTIYEPKKRRVVSQNMIDKTINHLIARQILMPSLVPCLIDQNVASRVFLGTKKGLDYLYKFKMICDCKYKKYYILKCDISSFFASIDHDVLKQKLTRRIKDKDALDIIFKVIDSDDVGISIRKYDFSNTCNFLFK